MQSGNSRLIIAPFQGCRLNNIDFDREDPIFNVMVNTLEPEIDQGGSGDVQLKVKERLDVTVSRFDPDADLSPEEPRSDVKWYRVEVTTVASPIQLFTFSVSEVWLSVIPGEQVSEYLGMDFCWFMK